MLKTITKFVVERRRLVRQRRQQVIEEGDSGDPAGRSEVPQRERDNGDPSRHSEVQQREGDNSDSSRRSKVPPQLAEPQLGEPPALTVWGKVKWYNAVKRYRRLGKNSTPIIPLRRPSHPPAPRRPAGLPSATPLDRGRRLWPDAECAGLGDVGALVDVRAAVGGDAGDDVLGGQHRCHVAATLTRRSADRGRAVAAEIDAAARFLALLRQ